MGTREAVFYTTFALIQTSKLSIFLLFVTRSMKTGGGKRDRTADLLHAMQALSQLSYTPEKVAPY
jgi:prenyltransferase beta subunit